MSRPIWRTWRQGGLKDWQFRQIVDAIQKLFELIGVTWFAEVDWARWRGSDRSLEPQHPTVARDYKEAATEPADVNVSPFEG